MRFGPWRLLLLIALTLSASFPFGPMGCQGSNSAAANSSRQQDARKRLLQKRREAIAKREQREQELQDAKEADDLKPDPSMIPSLH